MAKQDRPLVKSLIRCLINYADRNDPSLTPGRAVVALRASEIVIRRFAKRKGYEL